MSRDPAAAHPTPIPHSYWVEPGRLLAGEYPGPISRGEAADRIHQLLQAGITSFVDLTEQGELEPYESILKTAGAGAEYRRCPIRDHGVPQTADVVTAALDAIDAALAAGRKVYVHCRAGIGRTGTVIGCYLVRRRGCTGAQALDELQSLWQQCLRSRMWPEIPETAEQIDFVLQWRESVRGDVGGTLMRRAQGALVGLGVGDALGKLTESIGPDAQSLQQAVLDPATGLKTGAHTAMAQCLAESLIACGAHDPEDQMLRYLDWMRSVPREEPLSAEFRRTLATWQWTRKPHAGSHDPGNRDPHSIARTLAVALYAHDDPLQAIDLAAETSRTTQQSPVALEGCRVWTAMLIDAMTGMHKTALLSMGDGASMRFVRQRQLRRDTSILLEGRWRTASSHGGGVLSVIGTALWGLERAGSFAEGLLLVVTSSRAPQAAGALYGSLAGMHFGVDAIAQEWRRALAQEAQLRDLARRTIERSPA